MKWFQPTYNLLSTQLLTAVVISALMFFIAQGNSMFVTELFADKFVELVDSDTPAPNEERNDTNNNNLSEEDHLHYTVFEFVSVNIIEVSFHSINIELYPSVQMSISTPPPELS